MTIFLAVVLPLAGLLIGLWQVWQWYSGEAARVRTKVLEQQPNIECHITSYGGAGNGLTATIRNTGPGPAHQLALTAPTMGVVWRHQELQARQQQIQQIPMDDNAGLRSTRLNNPTATLAYTNAFGDPFTLHIPLTQAPRDDNRFSIGTGNDPQVDRPKLTGWKLWRLRKRV